MRRPDNKLLKTALACLEVNQPVIAVRPDKSPYRKHWDEYFSRPQTEAEVKEQFSNGAYGIARILYPACEYLCLDFDGEHAEKAWLQTGIILPETARNRTQSGGHHMIFRASDLFRNTPLKRKIRLVEAGCDCNKNCGVDFLWNGYEVIPPTPGYKVVVPISCAVEVPDDVVRLAMKKPATNPKAKFTGPIPQGMRDVTLLSIGGRHRHEGMEYSELVETLCRVNKKRCRPPLDRAAVEKIATSLCNYGPAESKPKHDDDIFTSVDTIAAVKVTWLWPGWIPLGYLTHIGGDPGVGKTLLALKIAAAISCGEVLPGSGRRFDPSYVILLSMEDQVADIIRPRLEAMGADLTKIRVIDPKKNIAPSDINMKLIEKQVKLVGPLLVVLDPIVYFAEGRDINQASQVREMLSPFAAMAARHSFAGIVAGHLNKQSNTKALYRASGSIDFSAVCRSFMILAEDSEDPGRRIIAQPKNNYMAKQRSLSFIISEESGFQWAGEVDISADDLVSKDEFKEREKHKFEKAKELLETVLGNGPRLESEVKDRADVARISDKTLWRAKKDLGVESKKQGFNDPWWWRLPGGEDWPWE